MSICLPEYSSELIWFDNQIVTRQQAQAAMNARGVLPAVAELVQVHAEFASQAQAAERLGVVGLSEDLPRLDPDGDWKTISGTHVHVDEKGHPDSGKDGGKAWRKRLGHEEPTQPSNKAPSSGKAISSSKDAPKESVQPKPLHETLMNLAGALTKHASLHEAFSNFRFDPKRGVLTLKPGIDKGTAYKQMQESTRAAAKADSKLLGLFNMIRVNLKAGELHIVHASR